MSSRRSTPFVSGRRPIEITATRELAASRAALFMFLAEPSNHRMLVSRNILLLELSVAGGMEIAGTIMIRGPLGLRRRVRICTSTWQPLVSIGGTAELRPRTTVDVSWRLRATLKSTTEVALTATVLETGPLDRLALWLGGAAWTKRLFNETLAILAAHTEAPPITPRSQVAMKDPQMPPGELLLNGTTSAWDG